MTSEKIRHLHEHHRSSGFYRLVGRHLGKLFGILVILVPAFLLLKPYLAVYQDGLQLLIHEQLQPLSVFAVFFVSESILGLIPPDLFMLWAKARFPEMPYLMVGALAVTSYLAGIVAYGLGRAMEHLPSIHNYMFKYHAATVEFIRQWGGAFILVAALLPIPYAMASTIAGLIRFPLKTYLLFGLARILRFYIYAAAIFSLV